MHNSPDHRRAVSKLTPQFLMSVSTYAMAALLSACAPASPGSTPAEAPAQVAEHVTETGLNTLTLTAQADARLGIETSPVERRSIAGTRTLGGDVIAPASGASAMTRFSATGSMDPATLAAAQVKADGDIAAASVAVDIARTRYNRINSLFEAGAESARANDDAFSELKSANANLEMLQSQRALLGQAIGSTNTPSRVWVRASVYSGDVERLDQLAQAQVDTLGGGAPHIATPIAAPSTADAQSSAAFLYYEVDNSDFAFRVGERVEVAVPTSFTEDALTVPWSAVLFDINGGEWVYERVADHSYARKRVEVTSVQGGVAVLARGPEEGAQIVSVGGPELFGTEFGVAH